MPLSNPSGDRLRLLTSGVVALLLALWVTTNPWALPVAAALGGVLLSWLWLPRSKTWIAAITALCGVVSVLASASMWRVDTMEMPPEGMLESLLVCGLIASVTRWGAGRAIALSTPVAAVAVAVSIVRVDVGSDELSGSEMLGAIAFWLLGPIAAALAGLYLRYVEFRREKAITIAKQTQRLELAHDLHDYVAHDVSAMIVQAQAAQVFIDDRDQVQHYLQNIEEAGLAAMNSMDRTVHVLRGQQTGADPRPSTAPGLEDVPTLVERFSPTVDADIALTIDPMALQAIPRELDSTAHRIIVESLTNVRRHAPMSTQVTVDVKKSYRHLNVTVTNVTVSDFSTGTGRQSGIGLSALNERVEALGGTFRARAQTNGWQVHAILPFTVESGELT